jgi:hypothetical protein
MMSFLAMILTMRVGLGSAPVDRALLSLREEAATVAAERASRDEPGAKPAVGAIGPAVQAERGPPRTREEWLVILTDALSNQTLANAAMWVAHQPLSVTMSPEKFFVSVRIATP